MAGPGKDKQQSVNENKANISESKPVIDVTSPNFNPYKALFSDRLEIPYPEVQVFKNVYEYERKTSLSDSESASLSTAVPPKPKPKKEPTKLEFRKEGAPPKAMKDTFQKSLDTDQDVVKDNVKKKRFQRNILTRMELSELQGPLNLLQQCLLHKHHVRVWTRGAVSIRGVCKGYIVAFDRHFNMAMIDVDEIYKNPHSKKKRKKVPLAEESKDLSKAADKLSLKTTKCIKQDTKTDILKSTDLRGKLNKSQQSGEINPVLLCESTWLGLPPEQLHYRHVNQLFIRGDNIVCVNIIPS